MYISFKMQKKKYLDVQQFNWIIYMDDQCFSWKYSNENIS